VKGFRPCGEGEWVSEDRDFGAQRGGWPPPREKEVRWREVVAFKHAGFMRRSRLRAALVEPRAGRVFCAKGSARRAVAWLGHIGDRAGWNKPGQELLAQGRRRSPRSFQSAVKGVAP